MLAPPRPRVPLPAVAAALLALAGCGSGDDDGERRAATDGTRAATETAPERRAPAARRERRPRPARSAEACRRLWNANESPSTNAYQSPADFLVDLAEEGPTPVLVTYERRTCSVIAPLGPRSEQAHMFYAPGGTGRYSTPSRIDLVRLYGGRANVRFNARATRGGKLLRGAPR